MQELIHIHIDDLDASKSNVRSKHSKEAVKKMAASIKANGIINAPTVKKKDGVGYEIIAGKLRVAGAELAGYKNVYCSVVDNMTDAQLVELSLSENVQREDMDDLECFVAFDRLARSGKSVAEIAASFSMKEIEVRRSLAIGALPKQIIKLAHDDKIYSGALKAFTTATKEKLVEYLKIPARNRPRSGWEIQNWLEKKSRRISVAHALFDEADYKGGIIDDLFALGGEARCFADADAFWKLQNKVIEAHVERLKKAGWPVVRLTEWRQYDYRKVAKSKGGKAYVAVLNSGQVIIKTGLLPHSSKASGTTQSPGQAHPELTAPMQVYCRAHRHLAIQDELACNNDVALALAVTLIITGARGWRIEPEDFKTVQNKKHAASIRESMHRRFCVEQYEIVYKELGLKAGKWVDPSEILRTAAEFDRESLLQILSALVSERLKVGYRNEGGKFDNTLAELLELEAVDEWKPDASFWSGIRSHAVMMGMLKEMAPPKLFGAIPKNSPLKELRGAARKYITLERLAQWRPKWLCFPAGAYTKKHRLEFVSTKR